MTVIGFCTLSVLTITKIITVGWLNKLCTKLGHRFCRMLTSDRVLIQFQLRVLLKIVCVWGGDELSIPSQLQYLEFLVPCILKSHAVFELANVEFIWSIYSASKEVFSLYYLQCDFYLIVWICVEWTGA